MIIQRGEAGPPCSGSEPPLPALREGSADAHWAHEYVNEPHICF